MARTHENPRCELILTDEQLASPRASADALDDMGEEYCFDESKQNPYAGLKVAVEEAEADTAARRLRPFADV